MNNTSFIEKGLLYLWHKDNCGSINSEDIDNGTMVYISAVDGLEVDGYDGTVGKAGDFREKLYVEYEWKIGETELFEFNNEDSECLNNCLNHYANEYDGRFDKLAKNEQVKYLVQSALADC